MNADDDQHAALPLDPIAKLTAAVEGLLEVIERVGGRLAGEMETQRLTPNSLERCPALMTYEETAAVVGISRRQIQRMAGDGSFPAPKKFGKGQSAMTRFNKIDVVKWIEGGCRRPK